MWTVDSLMLQHNFGCVKNQTRKLPLCIERLKKLDFTSDLLVLNDL